MKLYRVLSLIIVFLLFSLHSYADIPSSPRSRAAISQVRPALEIELASAGFRWGSAVFIRIFKASDELVDGVPPFLYGYSRRPMNWKSG